MYEAYESRCWFVSHSLQHTPARPRTDTTASVKATAAMAEGGSATIAPWRMNRLERGAVPSAHARRQQRWWVYPQRSMAVPSLNQSALLLMRGDTGRSGTATVALRCVIGQ